MPGIDPQKVSQKFTPLQVKELIRCLGVFGEFPGTGLPAAMRYIMIYRNNRSWVRAGRSTLVRPRDVRGAVERGVRDARVT